MVAQRGGPVSPILGGLRSRYLRGALGRRGRCRAHGRRAIRHRTRHRARHSPLPELGRGPDGRAPGRGGGLHGCGASRGRPHRPRGQRR